MGTNEGITVLVVDDHPVVRDGLEAMLSLDRNIQVVGQAGTAADAISQYQKLRPAVVVMDLLLPDMSGAEAIRQIINESPDAQIVVLTSVGGDEQIYRALEAGARGYMFKDMARKELTEAIRSVHQGRRYIPPQVGAVLAESVPRSGVSAREIEVLELVAAGLRNKEIAYKLSVSEATVCAHIRHLLEKLHASDRTHAVMIGLKRGFIRV
jgi:DNA-binding NarL/FixJ family response regulator